MDVFGQIQRTGVFIALSRAAPLSGADKTVRGALALDGEGPSDEEEDDDSYEAQYLAGCDEYI